MVFQGMEKYSFEQALVDVRSHLGNSRIKIPKKDGLGWSLVGETISLKVEAGLLCDNFQMNHVAAPSFALCLAYWLEEIWEIPFNVEVEIIGEPPQDKSLHWNRNQFVLSEYEDILAGRFKVAPCNYWSWPSQPVVNKPTSNRESDKLGRPGSEAELERLFVRSKEFLHAFRHLVGFCEPLNRQFPLGLFDGEVKSSKAWFPGRGAQIDLWTSSTNGNIFHAFELKKASATPLGILPEAFCYLRLLHYIRQWLSGEHEFIGDWEGLRVLRISEQMLMWLLVTRLHPLLFHKGRGPLEWFNQGMEKTAKLQVLLYEEENGVIELLST